MAHLLATDYAGLDRVLGDGQSRKIGHNTFARRSGPNIVVRLHCTDIVQLHPDGSVTVNSGGYRTVTTKERINQFLPRPVGVIQKDFEWFFVLRNEGFKLVPFENHTRIRSNGEIVTWGMAA